MKRKDSVFAVSSFRFCNRAHINISVPRAASLISMTLSLSNNRHRLLKSPARVSLLTASEKEEKVSGMTDSTALIDIYEEAKRAMEVLRKMMTCTCYMYDAAFHNNGELHESGTGEELSETVYFLF